MRPARELLADVELRRRAWRALGRVAVCVAGGGLALIAASAMSLLVTGTAAKLVVWAATLVVILAAWCVGVIIWEVRTLCRLVRDPLD